MPSGATPRDIFTSPAKYGGEKCAISIPKAAIDVMRERLPVTREEAFQFVNPEFAAKADEIWNQIGRPVCNLKNAWQIFEMMLPHFHDYV